MQTHWTFPVARRLWKECIVIFKFIFILFLFDIFYSYLIIFTCAAGFN